MTLRQVLEKCSTLQVFEERSVTDNSSELVFFSKDTKAWAKVLTEALGPAVKPAGADPAKDDLRLTENYGGILKNQTLFVKELAGACVIAMFWPWQDGLHTTFKMAIIKG